MRASDAVWLVQKYVPEEYYIQFYKIEPEDKVGIIDVRCIQLNNARTEVQVTYEYIGLSEKGNRFISSFTAAYYNSFISEWKKFAYYLFRDKVLSLCGCKTFVRNR